VSRRPALAWPSLVAGTGAMSAPVHMAHESGVWNLGTAAAFLAVAAAPRLAAGALPFLGTVAVLLAVLTVADLRAGHVAADRAAAHLLLLAGWRWSAPSPGGDAAAGRCPRSAASGCRHDAPGTGGAAAPAGPARPVARGGGGDRAARPPRTPSWCRPTRARAPGSSRLPDEVTLTFTEGVSLGAGYARVLDASGERVDTGAASVEGDAVVVPLRGDLPDDGYLVTYRVVSADSHPISGAFSFVVGDGELVPTDAAAGAGDTDPVVGAVLPAARWLGFAGLSLAIGVPVLLLAAWPAGWPRRGCAAWSPVGWPPSPRAPP
jgi:hypothetical protein